MESSWTVDADLSGEQILEHFAATGTLTKVEDHLLMLDLGQSFGPGEDAAAVAERLRSQA